MGCGILLTANTEECVDPSSHTSSVSQCTYRGCHPCSPDRTSAWVGVSWLAAAPLPSSVAFGKNVVIPVEISTLRGPTNGLTLEIVYDLTFTMAQRLAQLPNVSLHDFRAAEEVTHDLNNYGDVIHHSPAIDLEVLSWLANGKYLVDRAAPTAPLDRLKAQVEAYRVADMER